VREQLADLVDKPEINDGTAVLDSDLSKALKQFQLSVGIKQTGTLDPATIAQLNGHNPAQDRKRLIFNLERIRWLPKEMGSKYVLVNQAGFEVQVIDNGRQVWQSRVIVGKPTTQTAVFNNQIQTVVFNPYWGVPASIVAKEYLPKLQQNPYYLDDIGFEVTTLDGRQVSSADVDWWSYSGKSPYNVQQPPGQDNALGELKFLFPNAHNIYMHDTPNRELFANSVRDFSHGCVRVQNPRDYATVLLGWDRDKIDSMVESGETRTVKLPVPVPIHIAYFTAWPDASGKVQYFGDIYGRDAAMDNAMSTVTLAQR
jgi:L,D-transpeptidase YcbB